MLIATDDADRRGRWAGWLAQRWTVAEGPVDRLRAVPDILPATDCVVYSPPQCDGAALGPVARLHDAAAAAADDLPAPATVLVARGGSEAFAVAALKAGADDYLVADDTDADRLVAAVGDAIAKVRLAEQVRRRQRQIERQASIDELTGLYNRRFFFQRAGEEFSRAARYGNDVALIMMDVDHFKAVNDTHGHPAGDRVLRAIGGAITTTLRQPDVAGRYGGEEFAVVLGDNDTADALSVAQRLRSAVARLAVPLEPGGPLRVTCSMGVAQLGADADTLDGLIEVADQRLLDAKRAGRDRVHGPPGV